MTATVKKSLKRLVDGEARRGPLPALSPATGIPSVVGSSPPKPAGGSAAGSSSISSPLTVETIEGSSSLQLVSSDGFFVISLPLTVDMVDSAGQAVEIKFPS